MRIRRVPLGLAASLFLWLIGVQFSRGSFRAISALLFEASLASKLRAKLPPFSSCRLFVGREPRG